MPFDQWKRTLAEKLSLVVSMTENESAAECLDQLRAVLEQAEYFYDVECGIE